MRIISCGLAAALLSISLISFAQQDKSAPVDSADVQRLQKKSASLTAKEKEQAQQFFKAAFAAYQTSKFEEAEVLFQNGLKINPADANAHYFLGLILRDTGKSAEAKASFAVAAALAPGSVNGTLAALEAKKLEPPKAGATFRDCPICPEMVTVPAGSFDMGSPASEVGRFDNEGPVHPVTVKAFAAGKFSVTFAEWDACVAESQCPSANDSGYGRGTRPVINVSYTDALGYAAWLSTKTGKKYRLLSEAEWEYAARAGTRTARFWGDDDNQACQYANVFDVTTKAKHPEFTWEQFQCTDGFAETAPVGSFKPNAFGLYDMLGNVWQWVEDCYNKTYDGAPGDGRAWSTGDCSKRVARGGSWDDAPRYVRSAERNNLDPSLRNNNLGFRVARTLP